MSLILLGRPSLQNHSISQLTVYYILAVQFRTHSVGEKVIFLTKLKYKSTSNLFDYHINRHTQTLLKVKTISPLLYYRHTGHNQPIKHCQYT